MDEQPNASGMGSATALRRLAASREDAAWTAILQLHGAEILRAAQRILGDAALAEDACQETLLQVRDRAGQFRGCQRASLFARESEEQRRRRDDLSARNWIMRIACNTALHILRQRRRASRHEASLTPGEFLEVDVEQVEALAERVRRELAELPEKERRPLLLHFFGGLDYASLSEELGCGVSAARVRVHRALKKLRQRLVALGLAISLAALYTLLEHVPARVAGLTLDPAQFARWQSLLLSSQHAAIDALADERLPHLARLGYAAATAVLCGALALSNLRPARTDSPQRAQRTQSLDGAVAADPRKNPVSANSSLPATNDARQAESPRMAQGTKILDDGPPAVRPKNQFSAISASSASSASSAVNKSHVVKKRARGELLFSRQAELKMLRAMQQDLNRRVERIHQQAAADGGDAVNKENHARLERAAEEQAQIARLAQQLAEAFRN